MSRFLRGARAIGRKLAELGVLPPEEDDEKLADLEQIPVEFTYNLRA